MTNFIVSLISISKKFSKPLEFWCMNSPSVKSYRESQTAISGLGRRVGQLDAGQTGNAEYQGTEPDQSPHGTETSPPRYAGGSPPED
ncbi:hypothetical protein BB560_006035, partial [Smittium megazygosporum]